GLHFRLERAAEGADSGGSTGSSGSTGSTPGSDSLPRAVGAVRVVLRSPAGATDLAGGGRAQGVDGHELTAGVLRQ
ncbi:hypothetical protein RSW78_25845, partial [Escherichia coli]|uniref:hypothetical protein n=1 Tax=Escherichia coli TaxID=562 RepID=UPI0028DF837F